MATKLLTDLAIRNAKPRPKDYRLADGEGLYLLVAKTGGKSYQYRYKHNGKPLTVTLKGIATLAAARDEADRLRKMVAAGDDPRVVLKLQRATKAAADAQTFAAVAARWMERKARREGWSPSHHEDVRRSLHNHLADLDPLPVAKITADITSPLVHGIEEAAPGMASRVVRRLHAVMDYAVETGAIPFNPLPRWRAPKKERPHYAARTALPDLGAILRQMEALALGESARRAHLLLVYTAQRVAEVVGAEWGEFDLRAGVWSIPRARMKRKDVERGPHLVPLPPVLLTQLRKWRKADGDDAVYVCPSVRNPKRPLLPEGIAKVYRNELALTRKHSPHSWRAAFSSVCRDAGKSHDVVEAQLDHNVGSMTASAYDRAQRLELRRDLVAWYEATLLAARDGATVLAIRRGAA